MTEVLKERGNTSKSISRQSETEEGQPDAFKDLWLSIEMHDVIRRLDGPNPFSPETK